MRIEHNLREKERVYLQSGTDFHMSTVRALEHLSLYTLRYVSVIYYVVTEGCLNLVRVSHKFVMMKIVNLLDI